MSSLIMFGSSTLLGAIIYYIAYKEGYKEAKDRYNKDKDQ